MSHYHFIGIGGVSMSGIAMILKERGHQISGSDRSPSSATEALEEAGITVSYPQSAKNIVPGIDTVVFTAAIPSDNPELVEARRQGIRTIERSVMLGELLSEYDTPIGVAGTHGKTSTSSMLSCIHLAAGLDPTIQIGGTLASSGTNYRVGHGDSMIIESCEYCDSFLQFRTKYAVVTNIEAEHLDYFKTFDNVKKSFRKFAEIMVPGGALITSTECAPLFEGIDSPIVTVSLTEPADITAADIHHFSDHPGSSFHVIWHGQDLGLAEIFVPGDHLVYDALCACAVALSEGIEVQSIFEGLASYRPTKRRFELRGKYQGALVVDDYAHHPSEITATLKAARELSFREMTVVFQPHTYSRTISFYDDFVSALSLADHVILADIYAAREVDTGAVSSKMLADSLVEKGVDARYLCSFDEIKKFLEKNISTDDLLITMGAGDIVNIANDLTKEQ